MNKTNIIQAAPQKDSDYEVAVERYIVEIEHLRQDMAESQRRIERLRTETSGMLDETRSVLNKLAGA